MACHAGVAVFCTARQCEHREYSAVPTTGWTSDDTSRNGVPFWMSGSSFGEPQIWQAVTGPCQRSRKARTSLATVSTSARLMYWFTGRVRIRSACRSVIGKSPILCPRARAAGCRWMGTG